MEHYFNAPPDHTLDIAGRLVHGGERFELDEHVAASLNNPRIQRYAGQESHFPPAAPRDLATRGNRAQEPAESPQEALPAEPADEPSPAAPARAAVRPARSSAPEKPPEKDDAEDGDSETETETDPEEVNA